MAAIGHWKKILHSRATEFCDVCDSSTNTKTYRKRKQGAKKEINIMYQALPPEIFSPPGSKFAVMANRNTHTRADSVKIGLAAGKACYYPLGVHNIFLTIT